MGFGITLARRLVETVTQNANNRNRFLIVLDVDRLSFKLKIVVKESVRSKSEAVKNINKKINLLGDKSMLIKNKIKLIFVLIKFFLPFSINKVNAN